LGQHRNDSKLSVTLPSDGHVRNDEIGNNERGNKEVKTNLSKGRRNTTHLTELGDGRGEIFQKKRSQSISHVSDDLSLLFDNKNTDTEKENEILKEKQAVSMVPVICIVQLLWPDRHSTNKLFRDPDEFQPNVNFI
jgi:hypothetical protein